MQNVNSQHPLEHLAELLAGFGDYPDGVEPVPACITGLAFFPGGSGLWGAEMGRPLPPMPVGKVMVVGHNFDSETNYNQTLDRGYEYVNSGAWGGILKLLCKCAIPRADCFFTNAYIGLNKGKAMDQYLGALDQDFVYRCRAFLLKQIQAQQPRLILTLGTNVPPVLAPLTHELTVAWSGALDLQEIDRREAALVRDVMFPGVDHHTTVIALTHPAMRHLNIGRRNYNGQKGDAAEIALVRDGLVACSLAK
jgi:hypothetical protein